MFVCVCADVVPPQFLAAAEAVSDGEEREADGWNAAVWRQSGGTHNRWERHTETAPSPLLTKTKTVKN